MYKTNVMHVQSCCFTNLRACLHEGGGPQVGEVTCLGILQPRHPWVHSLKIIEWSLST